jgi:hypothetical protein
VNRIVAVDGLHLIYIVVFHGVNETFDKNTVDFESIEVLGWILFRYFGLFSCYIIFISSLLAQGNNVGRELGGRTTHVSDVAGDYSFSDDAGDKPV